MIQPISTNEEFLIKELRAMCADTVQSANSGHPGAPIGMSPLAYVVFSRFLRFNPKQPQWYGRDRFILSNGHASALQYSLLHLFGYDLKSSDLGSFRQLHSKTPGHPERVDFRTNEPNPGIEVTTGPLGMGIANAVGLAIAMNAMRTYDPDSMIVDADSKIYVCCGDGCLQEGIASEACSLAGTLKLKRIILLYDDNGIQIDGSTSVAFGEDVVKRFEAYHWKVLIVGDADNDYNSIIAALSEAQRSEQPVMIKCKTTIGYQTNKENTAAVHGAPLGDAEVARYKAAIGLDPEKKFQLCDKSKEVLKTIIDKKVKCYEQWEARFNACKYKDQIVSKFQFLGSLTIDKVLEKSAKLIKKHTETCQKTAGRKCCQSFLQMVSDEFLKPYMIYGSADAASMTLLKFENTEPLQEVNYGIREFAMMAISNGIAAYGAFVPFDSNFMAYLSYGGLHALRVGGLARLPAIHVCTHETLDLGMEGSSHQSIEVMNQVRAIVGCYDWRPADAAEIAGAVCGALGRLSFQHVLCLSKNAPESQIDGNAELTARYGGYLLFKADQPRAVLISSGMQTFDCVKIAKELGCDVVSIVSWQLFSQQRPEYRSQVIRLPRTKCVVVEAFGSFGSERFADHCVGVDNYMLDHQDGSFEGLKDALGMDLASISSVVKDVIAKV